MIHPRNIADAYLKLWNEDDAAARSALLDDGWSAEARYNDPIMSGEGRDGIAAMITGARTRFPELCFELAGTPDGHGSFVRFSWTLGPDSGPAAAAGTDVVRLNQTGRIVEVIGFLDGAVA